MVPEEVIELIYKVPRPPGEQLPGPVDEKSIRKFEANTGLWVPPELRDLLSITNGPCIGPGGIFGIETQRDYLDIEKILERYPGWKDKRWLPVAGDGTGNYFLMDSAATGQRPILFVDTIESVDVPVYAVASDLWVFLRFLLEREIGVKGWPFDSGYVLGIDPELANCTQTVLPWKA